jgi:hypothetical protein
MYSKKINNPLYSKIESIVVQKTIDGVVKHREFDDIRNKSSVRAILTMMGFKPCNEANPIVWRRPKGIADSLGRASNVTSCARVVKRNVGRPQTTSEMPTEKGQQILEQIKEDGFYDVGDFDMSQSYLSNIMSQIRELGYTVSSIKGGNQRVIRYELNEQ